MSSPSTNPSSCDSSGAFPSTCAGTASTSVDSPSINPNPYTPNAQFQSVSQDAASSPAMARSVPPHQEPHYPESSEPFVYFTTDMANKAAEAYELEKFDSLVEWYHRNRDRHNFPRISFPNAEEPPVPHNNIQEEEQANVDRRPLKRKNEDSPPSSVSKQPRSEEEGECSKKSYLNIGETEEKEQEGKENPLKRMELMTNSTVFNAPCEVNNSEKSVTTEVKIEENKTVKTETVDKSEEIPGPIPPATDLHQDFLRHQQLLQQQQQHQQMMEQQRSQMAGQMPMGSMFPSGHPLPGVPHPSFSPGYPGMPPMMPFMGQPVNPPTTSKSKSSKSKPSPNPMAGFRMPPFPPNHPMFMQQQMQMNMMRQNMMHAGRSPSFGMYPMGPVPGPPFPGGMPSHPQQFPYPMMGGPMSGGPMHGPMNGPMSGPLPGYMGPPSNMLQAPNSAPPPTENNARNSPFMSPSPSSLGPQQLPAGNNTGGMLVVSGGTSSSDQSWPSFYGNPNPLPGFPSTSNESAPNAPSLQQLT